MHADSVVANGPTEQEIVRSSGQPEDVGGNDRQIDLAWAGGFFDGEGHIGIHRSRVRRRDGKATYGLQLSLAQVDRRQVARFEQIVGGQSRRYAVTQGGNRAPYKTVWYAWGPEASQVLEWLMPHLVGKREQAQLAIEFQNEKVSSPRRRVSEDELQWQESMSLRLRQLREEIKANS